MAERIGFIGLGIMGSRMAANVARAGFAVTVWNRTAETAERWAEEHGASVATTPADLAAASDIVVTMVVDGNQVETVLLGQDGAADGAGTGALFVDCSTIGPDAARRIGARLAERGLEMLDAPVTGSAPKAQDGTLTIMVGGSERAYARAEPLLRSMGQLVLHVGPLGDGQAIKLINNAVAAANTVTLVEALLVGSAAGVDLDALCAVMEAGSGASAMLSLKQQPIRAHDYAPLFKLGHMLKDVRLCLDEAAAAGVPFAAASRAAELLAAAAAAGHAEDDFAALAEPLEQAAQRRI
jgi:3-hydroxyisobutyrate dehydrogenase-like beta-hydroxyacid dehydrogenase